MNEPLVFATSHSSAQSFSTISVQAHDIIRTWAFYAITRAWMHDSTIPWKDIVISGHVLSNKKKNYQISRQCKTYTRIIA